MTRALLSLLLAASPGKGLQGELSAMARRHRGKVALYAEHLSNGASVGFDADAQVRTASVIKLALMVEAFSQVAEGKRALTDKVTLDKDNQVNGSGVLWLLSPGLSMTLEDAVVLMMVLSDNTATNLLIDVLGVDAVNARMQSLKLANTYLYKKIGRPPAGPMPEDQKRFGLGKTTPREMARLLTMIQRAEVATPELCQRMLAILRQQQVRSMIPRYLETEDTSEGESAIANKTGSLDAARNDVAIVWTQTGPVVLSFFTYVNQDRSWTPENEAEVLIGKMARAVVNTWSPKGLVRAPTP